MDLTAWPDAITAVGTLGVSGFGIWLVLRMTHATQQSVVNSWRVDLDAVHHRWQRDTAEMSDRIDKLEAENERLRDHVRACEDDTVTLRRHVARLEQQLGISD